MHGVPHKVANASAEMQEESEGASKQNDLAGPGRDGALNDGIGPWPRRPRGQPDNKPNGKSTQNDPGKAISDRQDRRELWPIMLDVGRERSGMFWRDIGHDKIHPLQGSALTLDHHLLYLTDRLSGVQPFWTGSSAVENGVASVEAERVFQLVEPFPGGLITAVG